MFDIVWFAVASLISFGLYVAFGLVSFAWAYVWAWLDDKDRVTFDWLWFYKISKCQRMKLRSFGSRTSDDDKIIMRVAGSSSTQDSDLTRSERKTLMAKCPSLFIRSTKVRVWPIAIAILSPLILWAVLTFWLPATVLGSIVLIAMTARMARRQSKMLKSHMNDPKAHQTGE